MSEVMILFLLLFIFLVIVQIRSNKNQNNKTRQSEKLKNNSNQITSDWIPQGASKPRDGDKQKSKSKAFGKSLLVITFLLVAIAMVGNNLENNQEQISKNISNNEKLAHKEGEPQKQKPIKQAEISEYALKPYLPMDYPKKYEKLKSRWVEINNLRAKLAKIISKNKDCDYVVESELSYQSSLKYLKFYASCKNTTRMRVSEFDIKDGSTILTEKQKAWSESDAFLACRKAIKNSVISPSTLDIYDYTGTSFYKSKITHNAVMRIDFDAKNKFGIKENLKATCHFPPGERGTVEITERR